MPVFKTDCRHYTGERPCRPSKQNGTQCRSCRDYDRTAKRLLLIKTGAPGDVLRTTALLAPLKDKYPFSRITWITAPESFPVLENNGITDEIWNSESASTLARLLAEEWDAVYCPENSRTSAAFCAVAKTKKRYGYTLSPQGVITPLSPAAEGWLSAACDDSIKKKNGVSYQEIMAEICGLDKPGICRPVMNIAPKSQEKAEKTFQSLIKKRPGPVIGINTGCGSRWPQKVPSAERFALLLNKISGRHPDWNFVLLGGTSETEKNRDIISATARHKNIFTAGTGNTVNEFAALIGLCDAILCGDTLALHIASALEIPAVALFGPTSRAEIFTYGGLIKKIAAQMDCLCCYGSCAKKPDCMDAISPEAIESALEEQLARRGI